VTAEVDLMLWISRSSEAARGVVSAPAALCLTLLVSLVSGCKDDAALVTSADAGAPDAGGTAVALTPAEEAIVTTQLAPLPEKVPANPTNKWADDPRAAALGQKLFFETGYATAVRVKGPSGDVGATPPLSCATCHAADGWFVDPRSPAGVSHGIGWTERHSPTLVNAAFFRFFGWGGKQDAIWMQGANGMESSANFGGNRLQYVHLIFKKYRADYDAIFPVPLDPALAPTAPDAARFPAAGRPKAAGAPDGAWEGMTAADREIVNVIIANCGKALEAYQRKLISRGAPFERFLKGDKGALGAAETRGLRLFIGKAACVSCHNGPLLSDGGFHNIGVPQAAPNAPAMDTGRIDDIKRLTADTFNGAGPYSDDRTAGAAKLAELVANVESDRGAFRTPLLWNVEKTAPYMHNGGIATLEDVVRLYDAGGAAQGFAGTKDPRMKPLGLSADEVADLVAFLKALTGNPVAQELRVDTSVR
jgi:cytochrome c peroxidase